MKYDYYYKPIGKEEVKTTRKGLIAVLSQWCVKRIYEINGLGVDMTDDKKVQKVLRDITIGGCHTYIFCNDGMVWARKKA